LIGSRTAPPAALEDADQPPPLVAGRPSWRPPAKQVRWRNIAIALVVMAALPLVFADNPLVLALLAFAAFYGVLAASLSFAAGMSRQLSLAQAIFFAVGAYATAILTQDHHWNFWLAALAAIVIACVLSALVGMIVCRLWGLFFALGTFAFAGMGTTILRNWSSVTNGDNGYIVKFSPPAIGPVDFSQPVHFIYPLLIIGGLQMALHMWLPTKNFGRQVLAVRDNEELARSIGIWPLPRKVTVFVISCAFTAAAGALYGPFERYFDPTTFDIGLLINVLIMMVLGGEGHWLGPYLGSAVDTFLPNVFTFLKDFRLAAVGLAVVLIAIGMPTGIVGLAKLGWRRGRKLAQPWLERLPVRLPAWRRPAAPEPAAELTPIPAKAAPRPRPDLEAAPTVLEISDVSRTFGGVIALSNVSCSVKQGSITGLIGPNGAGKSTLMNIVAGTFGPTSGRITYRGRNVAGRRPDAIARSGIIRTYQTPHVFADMDVADAVSLAQAQARGRELIDAGVLLASAGLDRYLTTKTANLPAGTSKLLGVALGVLCAPDLLLLDEPAAGLTAHERDRLSMLLTQISLAGRTIWVVEHDIDFIVRLADWVHVLDHGQLICEGPPKVVMHDPRVVESYLGGADGEA
jgi:branched-chain amino acid transport system permease protein